ncbi:hypothetical protein IJJ12_03820 [bacterium]|nr:hypothetical protein [bacterium]
MTAEKFSALLTLIVPQFVAQVAQAKNLSETAATKAVYQSAFMRDLTDESTKLWHYGPAELLALYEQTCQSGQWDYAEAG